MGPLPSRPRVKLKRKLLHGLQSALYWSRADALYVNACAINGAMILMYHSVSRQLERRFLDPFSTLPVEVFEEQMRFLARHRHVVPLDAIVEAIERGTALPAGTVAITFDDGYRDNLVVAAPVLAQYRLPAVLYLATGYVERAENQWIDELFWAFATRSHNALFVAQPSARRYTLTRNDHVDAAYATLSATLLAASWEERRAILDEVKSQLRPDVPAPRSTLDWSEVKELVHTYPSIEIGLHSRNHVDLAACREEVLEQELLGCIRDVERAVGVRPRHFSYPYGRYSSVAAKRLRELGFRSASVTEPAYLITSQADSFALPRLVVPDSISLFRFKTGGAHPGLTRALVGRA